MSDAPAFHRKLRIHGDERESGGWLAVCPEHASLGFSVVMEDEAQGRYRLQCIEAVVGDECAKEGRLLELLGLDRAELSLSPNGTAPDGPVFVDLRDVEARNVEWIDAPFLPAGELVTNNADGDTGKGLLSAYWAARTSRGEFGEPRMVVFAVAEDAYDTILKPRLLAAGANLEYVRALGWRRAGTEDALLIPDDVPLLEQHLHGMGVRLLVIDPLLSYLSGKTNIHTDHEVKLALKPLERLAHNIGCGVLGNGHFSKDRAGGARRASSGSTAFTNTPRVGLYSCEARALRTDRSSGSR